MNKREERERKRREALVRAGERQREAIKASANRRISRTRSSTHADEADTYRSDSDPHTAGAETHEDRQVSTTKYRGVENVACPVCDEIMAEWKLSIHAFRVHKSWVEAGGLNEPFELEAEPAQRIQEPSPENSAQTTETNPALEMIPCPICRVSVRRRNLKKHKKKAHSAKDGVAAQTRKLGDMTYVERKQHLRRLFGPDEDRQSNDLFDSGRIVSGGAFGLGKSRKH